MNDLSNLDKNELLLQLELMSMQYRKEFQRLAEQNRELEQKLSEQKQGDEVKKLKEQLVKLQKDNLQLKDHIHNLQNQLEQQTQIPQQQQQQPQPQVERKIMSPSQPPTAKKIYQQPPPQFNKNTVQQPPPQQIPIQIQQKYNQQIHGKPAQKHITQEQMEFIKAQQRPKKQVQQSYPQFAPPPPPQQHLRQSYVQPQFQQPSQLMDKNKCLENEFIMIFKLLAEGFLWKDQKSELEMQIPLHQKMTEIQKHVLLNVEKPQLFDYFIYYRSNRIINFDQTIEQVIYDKRYPQSREKQEEDFQKLNNQLYKEPEIFSVKQQAKEFLIKFIIEYKDEWKKESYLTTSDDCLSSYLQQFKIDRRRIEKILINGVEYGFQADEYGLKFSEFPLDDDVITIIVSNNKLKTYVEYKGSIDIIILYNKTKINIKTQRNKTFDSILKQQNISINSRLSLCQSGWNAIDKDKQVGYYGIDNGWIIYVS
ncbi:hypothetical protein pb186bvf_019024 [Paramecium bursaria]